MKFFIIFFLFCINLSALLCFFFLFVCFSQRWTISLEFHTAFTWITSSFYGSLCIFILLQCWTSWRNFWVTWKQMWHDFPTCCPESRLCRLVCKCRREASWAALPAEATNLHHSRWDGGFKRNCQMAKKKITVKDLASCCLTLCAPIGSLII